MNSFNSCSLNCQIILKAGKYTAMIEKPLSWFKKKMYFFKSRYSLNKFEQQ